MIKKQQVKIKKKPVERKIKEYKPTFSTFDTSILVLLTCIISFAFSSIINYNNIQKKDNTSLKEFDKLINVYNDIMDNYYTDVDKDSLIEGAINGMIDSLGDPYSTYINESSSDSLNTRLQGSYEGIGIEIFNNDDGNVEIMTVFDGSPAFECGINSGDIIKSIGEVDFTGKTIDELKSKIATYGDEEFEMILSRNGNDYSVKLSRKNIIIKSVSSQVFERNGKQIGYIKVDIFSQTTYSQFEKVLKDLEDKKVDSLVIDLRNNTGGHLTVVEDMISLFLDKTNVIYQTQTKTNTIKFYSKGNETKKYPIVMLVNEASASASELMTAALKEQYGATVIGKTTFGKGTIQKLKSLSNTTEYKYTTKKWLTPKGNWINEIGISPDIDVDQSEEYYNTTSTADDIQLQKSLDYLSKK